MTIRLVFSGGKSFGGRRRRARRCGRVGARKWIRLFSSGVVDLRRVVGIGEPVSGDC